ncbi:hypothetical protein L228DRAFT_268873 [Xylona heveae TC161]|uniref:Uncharacterized protein n=1 Tax=Xylona heveae (strain CBS 132557 / TC161) TaxID=1328760 RepID=A0A165GNM7_XYLHT|nr:hypothetical protein L228DRAFT_268873 [Xylona heveae TC161]KZF22408.1 hypothetical protein L228DRAFT_268873 [Xylona heveae TC161]
MSPTFLSKRYYCNNYSYSYGSYNCSSGWYNWGRWVLLAILIALAFLFFFFFSCITSRRRRRAGRQPFYGTAWLGGKPPVGHGPATYNNNNTNNNPGGPQPYYGSYYQPPAPPYSPPANHTYYGNGPPQQSGVELQQPQNSYQPYRTPEDNVYSPPPGPPPGHPKQGDGIVR